MDLKELRNKKKLTQKEVARRAEMTRGGYSMIETGVRRPSPEVAQRIAKVLGFGKKWYRLLENKPVEKGGK